MNSKYSITLYTSEIADASRERAGTLKGSQSVSLIITPTHMAWILLTFIFLIILYYERQ
jgi:hypothetical protein